MRKERSETKGERIKANESAEVVYETDAGESVTTAVAIAVSSVSEAEMTDLEPLHSVVDSDALDTLFAPRGDGTPRTGGSVVFSYATYRVRVDHDGRVTIFE